MRWHVYLVRCADGTLYTGITTDLKRRVAVHNAGKGAKYTRARLPVKLVWHEGAAGESAAKRREHEVRTMERADKLRLIRGRAG
ncbi:MAG TPA: GIY-YIG nuclease family protein [Candidatus Eisenbacteria bacterium]|nr:GIY-YIG nuclease family protein [Candidatus Eisenbacteria bacterium]